MRVSVVTTPIRPTATEFPPFGAMAVIQELRSRGFYTVFLNIDLRRPDEEELRRYFRDGAFDVVGISAVVSTAYAYTKRLARIIREEIPACVIVVGGSLAASAEVLQRLTDVDICVAGDGELIFADLVEQLATGDRSIEALRRITGLSLLDGDEFIFTGFRPPPPAEELTQPDYRILEEDGSIEHYLPHTPWWLAFGGVQAPSGMEEMRSATVITTKGCVARCTFCHRFEKGYRMKPADAVLSHIRFLKERYNVGFVSIGDENFGSNKELTHDVVTGLGELGILWRASGVRARTVTPEMLVEWQGNGCLEAEYGIESGSQVMLDVMQKNTTLQMNSDALKWVSEAGMTTALQLVLGMPGETDATVRESTEFVKQHIPYITGKNGFPYMSINYAQALPGTPLYEYARQVGLIGPSLQDEEAYLLRISDVDAYATDHFLNYTQQPMLKVLTWRYRLVGEVEAFFIREHLGIRLGFWRTLQSIVAGAVNRALGLVAPSSTFRLLSPVDAAVVGRIAAAFPDSHGYFNMRTSMGRVVYLFYPGLRWVAYPVLCLGLSLKHARPGQSALALLWEHVRWSVSRLFQRAPALPSQSLRKTVADSGGPPAAGSSLQMEPLRLGR